MKINEEIIEAVFESLLAESKKDKKRGRTEEPRTKDSESDLEAGEIHTLKPHSWKYSDGSPFPRKRTKISKITSLEDLKRWSQDMGLEVVLSGRGHWEILDPFTGHKLTTIASSGSDVRAHLNSRGRLRRSLAAVGWPHDMPPE